MTERYLFRGKRLDNGKWVQGSYVPLHDNRHTIANLLLSWSNKLGFDDVDPTTVGRCVGLRDKNGTLIFEGDILKWYKPQVLPDTPPKTEIFSVKWAKKGARFVPDIIFDFTFSQHETEIIGNIYDNPELLEASE